MEPATITKVVAGEVREIDSAVLQRSGAAWTGGRPRRRKRPAARVVAVKTRTRRLRRGMSTDFLEDCGCLDQSSSL